MLNGNHKVRLYFIRHAESEGNSLSHTIRGRDLPSPLTSLGLQQSKLLGTYYKNIY